MSRLPCATCSTGAPCVAYEPTPGATRWLVGVVEPSAAAVRRMAAELMPSIPWLDRPPTAREIARHAAAHPIRRSAQPFGRDERPPAGAWLVLQAWIFDGPRPGVEALAVVHGADAADVSDGRRRIHGGRSGYVSTFPSAEAEPSQRKRDEASLYTPANSDGVPLALALT